MRRTPEGLCAALVDSSTAREALLRYSSSLGQSGQIEQIEQPEIAVYNAALLPKAEECAGLFSAARFDHILVREPGRHFPGKSTGIAESFSALAEAGRNLLAAGGDMVLLCSPPPLGERISRILSTTTEDTELVQKLKESEDAFFTASDKKSGGWNWDEKTMETAFTQAGFTVTVSMLEQSEERLVTGRDLSAWFDRENSRWGAFIAKNLGEHEFLHIETLLQERIKKGPLPWKWKSILLKAKTHA
jgi:putative ATPase